MISNVERMGEVQGVSVLRVNKSIRLIFFGYDNILFCIATTNEWTKIKTILQVYEQG